MRELIVKSNTGLIKSRQAIDNQSYHLLEIVDFSAIQLHTDKLLCLILEKSEFKDKIIDRHLFISDFPKNISLVIQNI